MDYNKAFKVAKRNLNMASVIIEQRVFNHDAQGSGFEPSTHVDLGVDFKKFLNIQANNYILEGIRGTGKTHILKMIINEIKSDFSKYKVIPSLVTIAGAPEICKTEPKYFRVYLYTSIIKNVCNFILENKSILLTKPIQKNVLDRIKGIFPGNDKENTLESGIKFILSNANSIIRDLYDNPDKIIKNISLKENASISAGIDLPGIGSIAGEDTAYTNKEETKEYAAKRLSEIYGADVLLSFLRTVREVLDLNYVYLLFDECSESTKIMQKETFRLCKQIRASCSNNLELNKPDVAFMAAVYPPQSTYYPSISKGDDFNFEPGHDCSPEYLELDELNEEFESFYKQLMENRFKLNNGFSKNYLDFFDGEEPIMIAAYCSGGVPRRFLEIIKQAYSQLSRDFNSKKTEEPKRIDASYILAAVGQVIESPNLLNSSTLTEQDRVILERVLKRFNHRNKTVETKNIASEKKVPITIYFTTAAKGSGELANLISVGLIHDKKRSRSRKSSIESWQGAGMLCSLDIGLAVHRGVITRSAVRLLEICQKDIKLSAYRGFTSVLDISLEGESLDEEMEQTLERIHFLENRMLELDKSLLEKNISEELYSSISNRTNAFLSMHKKRYSKLKEKSENLGR